MVKSVQRIPHPKKVRFIELYRETHGFISDCARAVGIDRSTYYEWLDKDKDFALAIADAEAETNDEMKQALIQKAADGDMTGIIFWLKSRHPEFKPQPTTLVQVNNYKDEASKELEEYQ